MFTKKELEIVKDLVEQEIDELEAIASDEDVEEALDEGNQKRIRRGVEIRILWN